MVRRQCAACVSVSTKHTDVTDNAQREVCRLQTVDCRLETVDWEINCTLYCILQHSLLTVPCNLVYCALYISALCNIHWVTVHCTLVHCALYISALCTV